MCVVRVFLAGGGGVIGRPLIWQLVEAGHDVVASTRRPERIELLHSLGASPVLLDAFDRDAVRRELLAARPEVVIHQLTALPARYEPAKPAFYTLTNRLRTEATRHLVEAARASGARRFVFQSISFMYELRGPRVLDETAPLARSAPEPFGSAVRATIEGERLALESPGLSGVVLRYGQLYGPGTYFGRNGDMARRARRRLLPIVGEGSGVFSFLHVEDAAAAAVRALSEGSGVYNVTDDEPAPAREWIPAYCAAVGAPEPLRIPFWLARLLAGRTVAANLLSSRGASNAKAKTELGWKPLFPSWREGFHSLD